MIKFYFSDPFVKVYLLNNGKRIKKKKTAVRKNNRNPVWNEALAFGLSSANLSNAGLEVRYNILVVNLFLNQRTIFYGFWFYMPTYSLFRLLIKKLRMLNANFFINRLTPITNNKIFYRSDTFCN